jgi:glutamate-1-semialdehyde 2,1-aminomutase
MSEARTALESEHERAALAAYADFAKRSGELFEAARRAFPGGDTRASAHFAPHPLFVERAAGARLYDADGHEYVDFMNNFTSLIHGHGHPAVVAAVSEQLARGTAYAAPTRSQVALAEELRARVPSLELLRFASSGSEATLMCLRAARAATGRQKIMKMEGGYHGSYEQAEVSLVPLPDRAGPRERPRSLPVDASIPDAALRDTIACPYNEPELASRLVAEHARELACVIVEPVLASMGMVPATVEFLRALRDATARHGVILVFDEVVTFRVAAGGAQEVFGVTPDLTAMGKIIGGGLPIGAFGGRRDLLALFDPARRGPVFHASTFSGNPLSMAAGLAAMRHYRAGDAERLNRLGDRLRAGLDAAFRRAGVAGCAAGAGSLAQVHFAGRPPRDGREALAAMAGAGRIARFLHLALLRRGVFAASRLVLCCSTPMTEADVDRAAGACEDALRELRPLIAERRPELGG